MDIEDRLREGDPARGERIVKAEAKATVWIDATTLPRDWYQMMETLLNMLLGSERSRAPHLYQCLRIRCSNSRHQPCFPMGRTRIYLNDSFPCSARYSHFLRDTHYVHTRSLIDQLMSIK